MLVVFLLPKRTSSYMVRKYAEVVDEHYKDVLVDLEGCFDSGRFKDFLEKIGTGLHFVPNGAHWAYKAEKAAELLEVELAAVFTEFLQLSNELAFKLSILSVNRRVMSKYKMSRLEIHWGRKAPTVKLDDLPLSLLSQLHLFHQV